MPYQPKANEFFERRGEYFRCLFIDDITIVFEDVEGYRWMDTSCDEFFPAEGFKYAR